MKNKVVKGYKGFDKNLKCRGYQYEIGGEYEEPGAPRVCSNGFHFCEFPLDVLGYYEPVDGNRFCEVEAIGEVDRDNNEDTKCSTNKIKIGAEITLNQLIDASVKFVYEHTKKDKKKSAHKEEDNTIASNNKNNSVASNTGDSSVASNTGDRSVASNTGYRSVASNTGYRSVASNTGDSSVASNTGYSSVASNTGYRSVASNTGDSSVASNTGDSSVASNTGYRSVASNTGSYGIASSLGIQGQAKGGLNTWLVLAEWYEDCYEWKVKEVKAVKVDGKKIKEDTLYELKNGRVVKVKDANN